MIDTALVDESWKDYDKLDRKYHDRVLTQNKFIIWLGEAKKLCDSMILLTKLYNIHSSIIHWASTVYVSCTVLSAGVQTVFEDFPNSWWRQACKQL